MVGVGFKSNCFLEVGGGYDYHRDESTAYLCDAAF